MRGSLAVRLGDGDDGEPRAAIIIGSASIDARELHARVPAAMRSPHLIRDCRR